VGRQIFDPLQTLVVVGTVCLAPKNSGAKPLPT
jgi:hypothetical protein